MLHTVETGVRSIQAYRGVVPDEILDRLIEAVEPLRGARVVHVNATAYGGGVSELLNAAVPLWNGLGVITDWKLIAGDEAFFRVTKKIHNALQGGDETLSEEEREVYLATAESNARAFEERYDYVVIHDPQPAAMLARGRRNNARWIWRCHIDTGQPNAEVWAFLRGLLEGYDAAVYTMREFVPPDLPIGKVEIIPPAIDPLSPKNLDIAAPSRAPDPGLDRHRLRVSAGDADLALRSLEGSARGDRGLPHRTRVDAEPAACARRQHGARRSGRVGDVPTGARRDARRSADPRVHQSHGVSNIEVNAFQRLSDLVLQKSIREGFGLVVSEALWKGTPVVAGRAGGIPLQMADGVGGVLVDSVGQCGAEHRAPAGGPGHGTRARRVGARARAASLPAAASAARFRQSAERAGWRATPVPGRR